MEKNKRLSHKINEFLSDKDKKVMFIEQNSEDNFASSVLLPALIYAQKTDQSLLYTISTTKRQNQLMLKELPELNKIGLDYSATLALSTEEHACQLHYQDHKNKFSRNQQKFLEGYFLSTYSQNTGLLDEIRSLIDLDSRQISILKMQSVESKEKNNECLNCLFRNDCISLKYRDLCAHSDLIITKHEFFLEQKNIKFPQSKPNISSQPKIIIIDQCSLFYEAYKINEQVAIELSQVYQLIGSTNNSLIVKIKNLLKKIVVDNSKTDEIPLVNSIKGLLSDVLYQLLELGVHSSADNTSDEKFKQIEQTIKKIYCLLDNKYSSWYDPKTNTLKCVPKSFSKKYEQFILSLLKNNKVILLSETKKDSIHFNEILSSGHLNSESYIYYNRQKDVLDESYSKDTIQEINSLLSSVESGNRNFERAKLERDKLNFLNDYRKFIGLEKSPFNQRDKGFEYFVELTKIQMHQDTALIKEVPAFLTMIKQIREITITDDVQNRLSQIKKNYPVKNKTKKNIQQNVARANFEEKTSLKPLIRKEMFIGPDGIVHTRPIHLENGHYDYWNSENNRYDNYDYRDLQDPFDRYSE